MIPTAKSAKFCYSSCPDLGIVAKISHVIEKST